MHKYCLVLLSFFLYVQIALGQIYPDVKLPPDTITAPNNNSYSIVINIPQRQLYLFAKGSLQKTYPIAVGKRDTATPVGRVRIINKLVNPTWHPKSKNPVPPGPNNPLGSRWLGLSIPGYGIHGNNRPSSIGTAVSLGCIRMYNQDVEELYRLVSVGTTVDLVYETVILQRKAGELHVAFADDIYGRKPQDQTLEKLLAGLPISKIALPLIKGKGGPLPWELQVQLPDGKLEKGFYWDGDTYLPLSPFIKAFGWQRQGVEVLLPDGKVLSVDVVSGGELYLKGERLRSLLETVPGLLWIEEGLKLKIRWQEGETPPVLLIN